MAVLLLGLFAAPTAQAGSTERIAKLSSIIDNSSSAKERLAAVTALARLGDRQTLPALLTALGDPSELVRAVAATALGKLSARSSLPALKLATEDGNASVRERALAAYAKVSRENGLTVTSVVTSDIPTGKAGFGTHSRALSVRPTLYVVIKSSSDKSPGKPDPTARKLHADHVLATMQASLHADATITSDAGDAKKFGLGARHLDLSVAKLEQRTAGVNIEIEAQLRMSISDSSGRITSFVTGGAVSTTPRKLFKSSDVPRMRREALSGAVAGLLPKLVMQLRRGPRS